MKKIVVLLSGVLALAACGSHSTSEPVATSPDGRIKVSVQTEGGQLSYSISQDSESLIVPSKLGFELMGGNILGDNTEILSVTHSSHKETWETVWGESRLIEDNHNSMIVHTAHLDVEFRVFNDGVGFRYIFPDDLGEFRIREELTEYKFARADHKIWWMPRSEPYYEAYGKHTAFDEIDCAYTPVTITGADGRFYSIHEAALLDFAKVNLVGSDASTLKTSLTKWSDGTGVYVTDTRTTPWRTIIITDRAGGLIESHLMLNLNEPCKIEDTSWCKPGKYIGIWWELHKYMRTWYYGPQHGATTERTKEYIDFAAAHNIQAVLVEGWNKGWDGNWMKNSTGFSFTEAYPDYDFDEVMKYAASKGVQMIIHNETAANTEHYFSQIDEAYALYHKYGMHYIKTGNVNLLMDGKEEHDGQYGVNRLHEVIEKAADRSQPNGKHRLPQPVGAGQIIGSVEKTGVRFPKRNAAQQPVPGSHKSASDCAKNAPANQLFRFLRLHLFCLRLQFMILLFIWAISNFLENQMDNTADNCRSRNPDQRQYASLFQHLPPGLHERRIFKPWQHPKLAVPDP